MNPQSKYRGVITFLKDGKALIEDLQLIPETKPVIQNLENVWLNNPLITFEQFKNELIRQGVISEHSNEWTEGAISILKAYDFLSDHSIEHGLTGKEIFQAFTGSFTLTKVQQDRSFRNRRKTHETRRKEKHWENFYKEIFSTHSNGKSQNRNSHHK